ncbi:hypothetical protein H7J88_18875 [Mycolicibacterium flavescens]|uniref:hypothetical protein n=1 Tax=Mycolicibacterium flavescens TaxID=1776 RepID=UPI00104230FB|nr:hypothetical protein [Mycolicibacterium flavescens]MCV7281696.1 hypothetical protein [Mycolicibacterium flavescens]
MKDVSGQQHREPYGPPTLVAALVNILVVELAVWTTVPYVPLAIYVVPLIIVDLIAAVALNSQAGNPRQVGRGMLIGLLCVPAGFLVLLPAFLIVQAAGLV